jgi:hypothetical protein
MSKKRFANSGYGAEWSLKISLGCSGAADKVDQVYREKHDVGVFTHVFAGGTLGLVEYTQEKKPEHILTAHSVSTAHIVISKYLCETGKACNHS